MIELIPDQKATTHISVFLDGIDVTNLCFYAFVPDSPDSPGDGYVKLFKLNEDGKKYLDGNAPAQETKHGLVFWTWKEECPYGKLTNKQLLPYILLGLLVFGGIVVLGGMVLAITPIS